MHTLKLSIFIGLLSSCFVLGLVSDANADLFYSPNFYDKGVFTNADFLPGDNNYYFPNDYVGYTNYYQTYLMYHDYTVVNDDVCYREDWNCGELY